MGWKDRISSVGKAAWKHKGVVLRGAQLHPGVALVLKMKDLKPGDLARVSSQLLAADVERLLEKHVGHKAIVDALRPTLRELQDHTDVTTSEIRAALQQIADEYKRLEEDDAQQT